MFFTRLLSSIIIVAITFLVILSGGPLLAAVLAVISVIAFFELTKAVKVHTQGKSCNALETVGLLGIIGFYLALYLTKSNQVMCFALVMTFLAIMFVYVFSFPKFQASQVMSAFFSVIYAPVLLSFIYRTRELEGGIYIVWMIFISSWICDTCAYAVGMLLGRRKLAPKLSPKKSIEGALGGVIGSALAGALFGYGVTHFAAPDPNVVVGFAIIGAVGAVISQVGDLAASAIKRNEEIKDYGKLIPGHGGIMDRFDSVIFASPVIYFLAVFLL